jgi:hypothetical protein
MKMIKIKTFLTFIIDGWEPNIIITGAKGANCADRANEAAIARVAQNFAQT